MFATRKSLLLSLRNVGETLSVSAGTVADEVRGQLTREGTNARLEAWASRIVRNAEMTVSVHGRENLEPVAESFHGARGDGGPRARAFVVMSNHQSHYDVPVLYYVLGPNMRMVAKKELFDLPVFGRALVSAGFISVDRQNRQSAITSLAAAKELLASGTHIWIAPEGTRSPTGELLPFKKGGFILALDTGATVLPITIQGTRQALRAKGMRSRKRAEIHVTIHPPIETPELPPDGDAERRKAARDELMADVRRAIASAL